MSKSKRKRVINITKRGTGHIIQDLVNSSVVLVNIKQEKDDNGILNSRKTKNSSSFYQDKNKNSLSKCFLCQNQRHDGFVPFSKASKEMKILVQLILHEEVNSTNLTWFCLGCAGILRNLVKLKEKIDTITMVLKSVIRTQNKSKVKIATIFMYLFKMIHWSYQFSSSSETRQ
jgi:hypothetical protein